ncbi:serine protease 27-like [Amphiura filiformis]|uniref:serine protease 27-like n=1 Tax=Amphiura filiformis TaxID=82378 RepID=UPI003B21A08C
MVTFLILIAVLLFIGSAPVNVHAEGCGIQTAPLNTDQAGIDIVGGNPAQEGEWPWQAFIQDGDTTYGGVLVDPEWVLTWPATNDLSGTKVSMGSNNINNPSSHLQTRTVTQRVTHPNINGYDFMVSLLKLSSPFTITDYVRYICLPEPPIISFPPGTTCTAAGWGSTSESDMDYNNELLEVDVQVE